MITYTLIEYTHSRATETIYIEEPFAFRDLHPKRVILVEDGMLESQLPEDAAPICAADLPQGAWADYADPNDQEWDDPCRGGVDRFEDRT